MAITRTTLRKLVAALVVAGAAVAGLAVASTGAGAGQPNPPGGAADERAALERQLAEVRRATARYHDVRKAVEDGYVAPHECVSSPAGIMGYHYFNPNIRELDPLRPSILLYVPHGRGLKLAGVEYFQPDADGDLATDDDRPSLFGRPFDGPMPGHEPGMPVHYDLHAWIWDRNPAGVFNPWHTGRSC